MNKWGLVLIILLSLVLSACSDDSELSNNSNRVYLEIEQSNQYGATINPGNGYFVYDKGAIANIELEVVTGYNFEGWQGTNASELAAVESNNGQWKLNMDEDKNIRAELKLENFALATTSPVNGEEDIPYNLKKIILTFNNKLGISTTYPQINFSKVNASDDEGIDNRDFEIEDNQLIINLGGNFLDNSYLEFGEEYELEITNRILDEKGRSFAVPNIKFKIETVAPEAPFVGIDLIDANNQLEIFWQRTKDNLKGLGDKYAVEYRIYRSINDKEFSDEPYKIISLAEGDFQLDDLEIILREDINEDVDLFTNIYYYKVRAVNEYGKVSEFSNIVSTE
ncbi:Ig-like domain-containing protein [Halanaerobacter jeridensis]|uniref:SbsA Ig-like domain-containing protein n=1 Tax=Halanaerobacter jeridensis TaxID=706427 RepID=A0A939BQ56_9FIRM|nr:hypothetical protein [Halanaerobacter jeridensis]